MGIRDDGLAAWEPPMSATGVPTYVLLMMEDLFYRKLLRRQLEGSGYVVTEALSVERGLQRVREVCPDVILLDTWLEHGGGLRMLETLRADGEHAHLPVMLIGQDVRKPVESRAKDLGALGPLPYCDVADVVRWVEEASAGASLDASPLSE